MVGDKGSRCVFNRDGVVLPDRTGGSIKGTDEIGGNHGFYRETSSCSRNRSERYCSDQAVGRQGSEAGCVRGQRKGRQRAGCIKDSGGDWVWSDHRQSAGGSYGYTGSCCVKPGCTNGSSVCDQTSGQKDTGLGRDWVSICLWQRTSCGDHRNQRKDNDDSTDRCDSAWVLWQCICGR